MAQVFEEPISRAFASGYNGVMDYLKSGNAPLFNQWRCLIFLKVHLKHRELRFHRDKRLGDARIADLYDWRELHHVHCVSRAFYSGAHIDQKVYGSLFIWPANQTEGGDNFDFADLREEHSMLLRIGAVYVFSVMNDSGFALHSLSNMVRKITRPFTFAQGREFFVRLAHGNINLQPRPVYLSDIDLDNETYSIIADIPSDIRLNDDLKIDIYGKKLIFFLREHLERHNVDPDVIRYVEEGRYTFLFGLNGRQL